MSVAVGRLQGSSLAEGIDIPLCSGPRTRDAVRTALGRFCRDEYPICEKRDEGSGDEYFYKLRFPDDDE